MIPIEEIEVHSSPLLAREAAKSRRRLNKGSTTDDIALDLLE